MLGTMMKIIKTEQRISAKKSSLVAMNEELTTISKNLAETQAILETMLQDYQIVSEFSKQVIGRRIEMLTNDVRIQTQSESEKSYRAEILKHEIYDATEELGKLTVEMEELRNESLRTKQ